MIAKTYKSVTTLMAAAFTGDTATVKTMLDRGADVNARDRIGWTALSYATWKGHADVAELLRQAGGRP